MKTGTIIYFGDVKTIVTYVTDDGYYCMVEGVGNDYKNIFATESIMAMQRDGDVSVSVE